MRTCSSHTTDCQVRLDSQNFLRISEFPGPSGPPSAKGQRLYVLRPGELRREGSVYTPCQEGPAARERLYAVGIERSRHRTPRSAIDAAHLLDVMMPSSDPPGHRRQEGPPDALCVDPGKRPVRKRHAKRARPSMALCRNVGRVAKRLAVKTSCPWTFRYGRQEGILSPGDV